MGLEIFSLIGGFPFRPGPLERSSTVPSFTLPTSSPFSHLPPHVLQHHLPLLLLQHLALLTERQGGGGGSGGEVGLRGC